MTTTDQPVTYRKRRRSVALCTHTQSTRIQVPPLNPPHLPPQPPNCTLWGYTSARGMQVTLWMSLAGYTVNFTRRLHCECHSQVTLWMSLAGYTVDVTRRLHCECHSQVTLWMSLACYTVNVTRRVRWHAFGPHWIVCLVLTAGLTVPWWITGLTVCNSDCPVMNHWSYCVQLWLSRDESLVLLCATLTVLRWITGLTVCNSDCPTMNHWSYCVQLWLSHDESLVLLCATLTVPRWITGLTVCNSDCPMMNHWSYCEQL